MAGEKGRGGNFKELSLVIWSWILGGVFHFCFACGGRWCKAGVLFKKKVVYVQQRDGENMATGLLRRVVEEGKRLRGGNDDCAAPDSPHRALTHVPPNHYAERATARYE